VVGPHRIRVHLSIADSLPQRAQPPAGRSPLRYQWADADEPHPKPNQMRRERVAELVHDEA
jgi:hypothetical protein